MAGLMDRVRNWRTPKAGEGEGSSPADGSQGLAENEERLKRQRIALIAAGSIFMIGGIWWIVADGEGEQADITATNKDGQIQIDTGEMAGRNMSEKEWIAMSEGRLQQQDSRLERLAGTGDQMAQMQAQIDQLRADNGAMAADGQRVISAFEQENAQLRQQLSASQTAQATAAAGPQALYGAGGPSAYRAAGATGPLRSGELKVISFGEGTASASTRGGTPPPSATSSASGPTVMSSSPDYLPANSYAQARVIIGVDAASNVSSQSDPLPVLLRITGPARSVAQNGRVLTTDIRGCLVNGAARGDLSSEKVYVRLAKMTCPVGGGRFAESEVKGFIAFGGKTGVRGRVVSREGSLAGQAFFAGLVGGIGRGFSANSQGYLSGATTIVSGQRQKLGAGEIAQAGIGEGVSSAGDMVSEYLIEKAEQYQPVIEMPTGIDVEIVFLEGVQVRK